MGKKKAGNCHICGNLRPLTKEHIPPQAAFNAGEVVEAPFADWLEGDLRRGPRGRIVQGGAYRYTLCSQCNSDMGAWYGEAFAYWYYEGARILDQTNGDPQLVYIQYIRPLNIIKQIVAMTLSMNGIKFRTKHEDLARFVLDRRARYLDPRYRVFAYFNTQGLLRRVGDNMAVSRIEEGRWRTHLVTEISHPPFGYVFVTDGSMPDERFCEITTFKNHEFDEWAIAPLNLKVLPTYLPIPLDYRTLEEIEAQAASAQAAE